MKPIPLALLALVAAASPANAADPRLKTVPYVSDKVVTVQGRPGYQSMIEFAPGEKIENVAVGDSAAWQVTPNKRANLLFLKPLAARARTNMTVVTDQRLYLFDLSVAASGASPTYNMRFTYAQPRQVQPRAIQPPQQMAVARNAAAPSAAKAKLNYAWKGKGKKELLPTRSYDDGQLLYLQWPADKPLPALFSRGKNGKDEPLNYSQVGSFVVVYQVPGTLVMRLGDKTATLTNRGPAPKPVRIAER